MPGSDLEAMVELVQAVASRAGRQLLENMTDAKRSYVHSEELPKEVKAVADTVLERDILQALQPTGLAILSEEAGAAKAEAHSPWQTSGWMPVGQRTRVFAFRAAPGGEHKVTLHYGKDRKSVV